MGFRQTAPEEKDLAGRVYLDYAATAPFDMRLAPLIAKTSWANASSLYTEGRQARWQLEEARKSVAAALGAHAPSEITFTSGGTESDNTFFSGLAKKAPGAKDTYIVVSSIEHHAVLHAADALKARGFKIKHVQPSSEGIVTGQALEKCLSRIENAKGACALVSVQAVNNEIGTIQPIRELADIAHAHGALFCCDAVQALGKVLIDLEASGVDAASFSGHKVGALKGTGLLYVRRGVRCSPLLHGGGQESGLRSGTSNVVGACVLAEAVEHAVNEREQLYGHAVSLKQRLLDGVNALHAAHALRPTLAANVNAVPHIVSFLCDSLEGETLVLRLDNAGFAVSAGSACSSASLEPSHVLTAIGVDKDAAFGSLRISFGQATTEDDVDALLAALPDVLR